MASSRGVCYVAYGDAARREARESIESLRQHNPGLAVRVIGEEVKGAVCIPFPREDAGGRWAKLNLDYLSPFEHTLYLDADTRVQGDLSAGFQLLDDGFELAITASTKQGLSVLGNAPVEDREATFDAWQCRSLLGLQAGMFYFRRCPQMEMLFALWRQEWERFRDQDQPALLRALLRAPVKLWLLGRPFNGGELVEHLFGRAR